MKDLSTTKTILSRRDKKILRYKILKKMRKDVSYLLKPRPAFIPVKFYVFILSKFLYLDNKTLIELCLISSQKLNKI